MRIDSAPPPVISGRRRSIAFLLLTSLTLALGCAEGTTPNPPPPPPVPPPPPPPPVVVSVAIAPQTLPLVTGGATGQMTATVTNTNGPVTNPTVTWINGNPAAATISGTGATITVTAVAPGTATITASSGGIEGTAVVTVTDPPPTVTVATNDATGSEVGPDPASFTITRSGSTALPLAVNYSFGGTATIGADFTAEASPLVIPAGQASATFAINPIIDAVDEGDETVVLTLTSGSYTIGAPATATATIGNGTPAVTISVVASDPTAAEAGPDQGVFTITRTGPITGGIGIGYTISGTATNGTDYGTVSGTIAIAAGQSQVSLVVIPVADAAVEGDETIVLTLSNGPGYVVAAPNAATITVTDAPAIANVVTATATDAAASEVGPDDGVVTVSRTGSITAPLTVNVTVTGTATSGSDFVAIPASVVIPGGSATATITVTPIADVLAESGETVIVTVASGAYTVGGPSIATVTIADTPSPAGTIANGEERTGNILGAGETDTWTFTANQGDYIALSVGEVNGTDFAPWIRLQGPTGTPLGDNSGTAVGQLSTTAPTTGTYTVLIASADAGLDGTGTYRLTLAKAPATFTTPAGDQGGTINNGVNYLGSIRVGDLDMFSFTAGQGDAIAVSVGEQSGTDFAPWVRVITPAGVVLGDNASTAVAQVNGTAPVAGTYTVIVGTADAGLDGIGDYNLTLAKGPGTYSVPAGDQGGSLTNGANQTGALFVGDLDLWSLTAIQGESVALSIGKLTGADLAPWIRVIGPTGAIIGDNSGATVGQVTFTASVSGNYTVVIGTADAGLDATGTYNLTMAKGPGAFVVDASDQGGAMTNGSTHAGSIFAGDLDLWGFTATAGETILLSVGEVTGTDYAPWIRLIGPNGTLIGTNSGLQVGQLTLTAPATGSYSVIIGSANAALDGTGDYQLSLIRVPGTYTLTGGDQGGLLSNGVTQNGNLFTGDLDAWTFTANAGATIVIDVAEGVSTNLSPAIRLFSATGAQLATASGASTAQISVTVGVTGTYTIVVGTDNPGLDGTGDYTIVVGGASSIRLPNVGAAGVRSAARP